jgi:F0F1-type ATP synthase membrane subunit b/b'
MTFEHIVQAGSFGVLCYLVWWSTQSLTPKLLGVLGEMKDAINHSTGEMEEIRREHREMRQETKKGFERLEQMLSDL